MGVIDELLDELNIRNPAVRAMMADMIAEEMSVPFDVYMTKKGKTHTKAQCRASRKQGAPKGCVLHKPTIHKLTGARQILRSSTLIEDQCQHGIGHPNPDSAAFLDWRDGIYDPAYGWGVHGCDGCCGPLEDKIEYAEEY